MSLYVDIEKNFGSFHLKVKFIADDETVSILGASGCGKSLTLKCIAGIEKPDKGKIIVDGVTLFDSEKKINLSPQQRKTGFMFQNYALFPNMTIRQNIAAGALKEKNSDKRSAAVDNIMKRFGLTQLSNHYPSQISGGQQQRVALARILISEPNILLLDEPFSALDSHLRFKLERETRQIIRDFGKTAVLVSHDRDEVFRMSDRIAIMDNGSIQTIGLKKDVFAAPETRNGATLTGCKNISSVKILEDGYVFAEEWGLTLKVPHITSDISSIGIRMHGIYPGNGENSFPCRVSEVIENPFSYTIMLEPIGCVCTTPIGWETSKTNWQEICCDEIQICLPQDAILTLRN